MKSFRYVLLASVLLIFALPAYSLIDMRNANYSQSWVDMIAPSTGFTLRINRTYNSRALYNGMFGFGWCTDFETKLRISVANTPIVTDCGAGSELEFTNGHEVHRNVAQSIRTIMAAVRKRNPGKDQGYFRGIERQLQIDPDLRDEMAKQLHITANIAKGVKYFAEGRADDTIVFDGSHYVRTLANGSTQTFDQSGHLIRLGDRDGNSLRIEYTDNRIARVMDNNGNSIQFHYWPNSHYVRLATGPNGMRSSYKYSGEDLIAATNSQRQTYRYTYNKYYNMTKIVYPDGTYNTMTYNNDRDWVTSYRDRRSCLEQYAYQTNPSNLNYYSSSVVKTCKGKVTNKSTFSFWYKKDKSGEHYLAKTLQVVNGQSTETIYHPAFGRPVEIKQGHVITRFVYYPDGNLKTKSSGDTSQTYSYNNTCHKLSETVAKINMRTPSSGRAHVQTIVTQFFYAPGRCDLQMVKNSQGQYAKISYDYMGRIRSIEDQSKRLVFIKYDNRFGKPSVITRPGLGAVRFEYNNDGTINRLAAIKDEDSMTELQVANVFSNLMQLISPATADITNI